MYVIADNRIPQAAKQQLEKYAKLIPLETQNIVETSVSGHPDIFMTACNNEFVISPQIPQNIVDVIEKTNTSYYFGTAKLSENYPQIAAFNAVITQELLIHKLSITDECIENLCVNKTKINVNQGFTRCSLIALPNNHFITSDKGIAAVLEKIHASVLYVDSFDIILPAQKHGFIGGCMAFFDGILWIIGSLHAFKEGEKILQFLKKINLPFIELYNGPLWDGGSLFFLQ